MTFKAVPLFKMRETTFSVAMDDMLGHLAEDYYAQYAISHLVMLQSETWTVGNIKGCAFAARERAPLPHCKLLACACAHLNVCMYVCVHLCACVCMHVCVC